MPNANFLENLVKYAGAPPGISRQHLTWEIMMQLGFFN